MSRVGEDIQSLSRFVEAQRLAFEKLLKKYRKWTDSAELGRRFREGVFNRSASFSNRDFQPLLAQWTEVLARVRAPFDNDTQGTHRRPRSKIGSLAQRPFDRSVSPNQGGSRPPTDDSSSLSVLRKSWESGSGVDIDTALVTSPAGPKTSQAVYWVHADNVIQIHVLLLQYTRLQNVNKSDEIPSTVANSNTSPRGFVSAYSNRHCSRTDEDIGVIICSNPRDKDPEKCPSVPAVNGAAAVIRYSSNNEAAVVMDTCTKKLDQCQTPLKSKIELSQIPKLFKESETDQELLRHDTKDSERVHDWFATHQEVQPLVQIQASRTRFMGLKNSRSGGLWATLDKGILVRATSRDSISCSQFSKVNGAEESAGSKAFPHAVLEVRAEGDPGSDLIAQLDASYLVSGLTHLFQGIANMAS